MAEFRTTVGEIRARRARSVAEYERLGLADPDVACCSCVRPTFLSCGYCAGYGYVEEGTDGGPEGPCPCCKPMNFNERWMRLVDWKWLVDGGERGIARQPLTDLGASLPWQRFE